MLGTGQGTMPGRGRLAAIFACLVGLVAVFVHKHAKDEPQAEESNILILDDLTYWPAIPLESNKNRTQIGGEKACMYMLVRNWEIDEALSSIRQIEDRFNKKYRYPWVFLNDELFTEEFQTLTAGMVSGHAHYGHVPAANWSVPEDIDWAKFNATLKKAKEDGVLYGDSISYRNMCRFNSGQFFRHPILDPYDWYWRVEPGVEFYCDQNYDPFRFLRENNKVYGFVITISEYFNTIPTLWPTVKKFFAEHPEYIAPDNSIAFLEDRRLLRPDDIVPEDHGQGSNFCHFWSNFEIANLNFWRSQPYLDYFEYLQEAGGFYYERWGDAPVHSWALAFMANKSQIHHFSDIGYYHLPFHRCPHDDASFASGRCLCPRFRAEEMDFSPFSCLPRWWHHAGRQALFTFNEQHKQDF